MKQHPVLAGWLFVLVFIYPIPHTIALRNVLLLSALIGCAVWLFRHRKDVATEPVLPWPNDVRLAALTLMALTGWQLLQSAFISPRPDEALSLWRGDWLVMLLVMLIGWMAQRTLVVRTHPALVRAVALALGAHVLWLIGYQVGGFINTGTVPGWPLTPIGGKDHYSIITSLFCSLLIADLVSIACGRPRLLGVSARVLVAGVVITAVLIAIVTARNAVLLILVTACIGTVLTVSLRGLGRHPRWTALGLALTLLAGGALLASDARWKGFSDAVDAGLAYEKNLAWLDPARHPLPIASDGKPVDDSAFLRTAWASVGLKQIVDHPLGLGYGHKAFGWAVNEAYQVNTGIESSHSGLIDFTLANGVPGLLALLTLSIALFSAGARALRRGEPIFGAMLALVVIEYLMRVAIDGHLSGWPLELHALIIGLLLAGAPLRSRT